MARSRGSRCQRGAVQAAQALRDAAIDMFVIKRGRRPAHAPDDAQLAQLEPPPDSNEPAEQSRPSRNLSADSAFAASVNAWVYREVNQIAPSVEALAIGAPRKARHEERIPKRAIRCCWCARRASASMPRRRPRTPSPMLRPMPMSRPRHCASSTACQALEPGAGRTSWSSRIRPSRRKPDAVFPNNWVSFHSDGTIVLYPMATAARRLERNVDGMTALLSASGFEVRRVVDLTAQSENRPFLEGTGSLILDRPRRRPTPASARAPTATRSASSTSSSITRPWCSAPPTAPAGRSITPTYC